MGGLIILKAKEINASWRGGGLRRNHKLFVISSVSGSDDTNSRALVGVMLLMLVAAGTKRRSERQSNLKFTKKVDAFGPNV